MASNKRLIAAGAAAGASGGFDPLQNFETVTYTGNGGTQKITGYIRKGAAFNGSSSYITSNSLPISGSADFSISLWINPKNVSSEQWIAQYGRSFGDKTLYLQLDSNGFSVNNYTTGQLFSLSVTANNWYHCVIGYDSSAGEMFIQVNNGTRVSKSATVNIDTPNLLIGKREAASSYTNGVIDQVRVFDKVLSTSEVTTLYGETYASSTKSTTDIFGDGSGVALYELDEDASDTGDTYNGTPTNVNFLGMAFQPDLVWLKSRSSASWANFLQDSIRGAENFLISNSTNAEGTTLPHIVDSFDTNGFTVLGNGNSNNNGDTYVAWCWKAGGAAVSNTDGTITSTVSANRDAGFSIVSYTGNGTAGATVGHGLSSAPELIISKNRDEPQSWIVNATAIGKSKILTLNTSGATLDRPNQYYYDWNDTTITMGSDIHINGLNDKIITYCFHSVDEYQKVGTFDGTGTTTGNVVTTGFKPRFLMWKTTIGTGNWQIVDSVRSPLADKRNQLYANLSQGEDVTSYDIVDFNDTSFQMKQQYTNKANETYIYLAIA
jgi:hypothetical protein